MTLVLAGSLLVLALLDSTSFGTLLIPIWFLLAPGRVPVGRILVFLGTVVAFYYAVGLALLFGFDAMLGQLNDWLENPVVVRGQLALGAGLLVWSFFIGRPSRGGGRLVRWRARALGLEGSGHEGSGNLGSLVALALGTTLLEVATMLPYLGAIGLLTTSELSVTEQILALAAYCLAMILPALVLLSARIVAHSLVEPLLQRIARWLEKSGGEMTAWVVGIVGFLIARDALSRMPELLEFINVDL